MKPINVHRCADTSYKWPNRNKANYRPPVALESGIVIMTISSGLLGNKGAGVDVEVPVIGEASRGRGHHGTEPGIISMMINYGLSRVIRVWEWR